MSKKSENPSQTVNSDRIGNDDDVIEVLMKEYDALRDLYSRAEASAQSMFNFYLTLLSSIVGAVVLIVQLGSDSRSTYFTLSGMLFFAMGIGSGYLSAVASRYGHLARYARATDALRRVLLERCKGMLPPLYHTFMSRPIASYVPETSLKPTLNWLLPAGSFQLVIAVLNSAALAGSTWFLLMALQVAGSQPTRTLLTCGLIFLLAFTVCNFYTHLVQRTILQRLNVDLYMHDRLPYLAGKE